ncbi:NADH:ubiquinone oxidoreductase subunit E [Bradyrhizobium japonicum]
MSHDVHEVRSFEHPGEGRKRAKATPKGRQVDPTAAHEIEQLLGDRPRRRDLLIEYLHLIQDKYHQISAAHLAALADEMKLAFAEVFETATFYAHFDIVKEGEPDIAPLTIRVCDSLTCAMLGGEKLLADLQSTSGPGIRVVRAPCVGRCDTAPAAEVGHNFVDHATVANVMAAAKAGDTHAHLPEYVDYDAYVAGGGYKLLNRVRSGELPKDDLLKALDDASLRGLGGAGFPTGRKWRAVLGEPGPRLMAINGDEGEPGTFKDRVYLESDPHRFIEGMLLGAHVVQASDVYIYLRDEYPASREILEREIAKLPPGGPTLHMRRGAGAYICGEESSLLESIEGKRGLPRHKPPYPFQVGLFGLPTLINNIETLWWVRDIVEKGADWWKGNGRHERHGLRSFSVSGRVKKPRHEAGTRRHHCARIDRRILRRHGRRAPVLCVPAGRRVGRHPAGVHGRHPARFRHAGEIRLLHRLGRDRDPVAKGQRARGRAEPDEVLRGRELRPVHAVPCRNPEGGAADAEAGLEPRTSGRIEPGDARCLDLRARAGGIESAVYRDQIFP